jgi:hypothetical protein
MRQIPFDEDEAILLLDAYLRVMKDGQNRTRALADLSDVLRKRALAKGLAIDDSFRSAAGLSGRLWNMERSYNGSQSQTSSLFDKTVDLYKNNYPEYERRLNAIRIGLSSNNIPPEKANTAAQPMKVLKRHKESFRRWLGARGDARFHSIYWNYLVKILEIAADYGYIDGSLNGDVLTRVKTELFALPDFQANAFSSRGITLVALGKFIDYWNDDSKEDNEYAFDEGGKTTNEKPDKLLYEFGKQTSLAWTRPVRAAFDSGETFEENSWAKLYVWIVRTLYRQFPDRLRQVLQEAKASGFVADFLDRQGYAEFNESYRYSIKHIDDDFYLNTNYDATTIVKKIQKWLKVCGVKKDALKIYYVKTQQQNSVAPTRTKGAKRVSRVKKRVQLKPTVDAIREHFPNGVKFDDSTLAFLEQKMGRRIKSAVIDELQERMFRRKDGLYFLSGSIIDPARKKELVRQAKGYLKKNASFETQVLYDAYADALNPVCIRSVGDFEDWIKYLAPQVFRFSSIGKYRLARSFMKIETRADLAKYLLRKIRRTAKRNYGTLEENDIVNIFDGFSLEFLSYFVKKKADDVFVREINETICFQTVEGLGVPEDFSEKLLETLEQIDDLGFTPSTEAIHILLSANIGRNIRDEFGLEDDKSFRKLIESHYKGKEPRKWKSGVFEKEGN